jgi:hypothetical protein
VHAQLTRSGGEVENEGSDIFMVNALFESATDRLIYELTPSVTVNMDMPYSQDS